MSAMDVDLDHDPPQPTTCPDCDANLDHSRKDRLSLFLAALTTVLDPSQPDFAVIRGKIYNPRGTRSLTQLLDNIFSDPRGSSFLLSWIELRAVDYVSQKVSSEMDNMKDEMCLTSQAITPEFLATWDVNSVVGPRLAPTVSKLPSASQTARAVRENSAKDAHTPCQVIVTQLVKVRSNASLYFAAPFTLFLWANGASKQTIEALAQCGLAIFFTPLTNLLRNLALHCVDRATAIARRPHVFWYDNTNISTSIFAEQRAGAPPFQSPMRSETQIWSI